MNAQNRQARVRRTTAVLAVAVFTVTALGACSGGGSDGDGSDGGSSGDRSTDESTLTVASACSQLVGPRATLLDDALAAGKAVADDGGAQTDVDAAAAAQTDLFAIVAKGPEPLQDPAGVIVDYLDDPSAYETAEGLAATVTDAVAAIKKTCSQPASAS